jgi:hypothetical protein
MAGVMALICIGVLFNIWFVQNTTAIIQSLVHTKSGGDIRLQLSKSKFRYFGKKLELYNAVFYSVADSGTATTYQFKVPKLDLKLRSLWAFLAYRELLIDSISLQEPEVTATRVYESTKQERADISIPEEIGRIYNSILDALEVLQVKRFQIDGGRFNLVNKIDPSRPATIISNINFYISNLKITADSSASEKFLFSDNIVLGIKNQDIALPDGVHRISFKNLLINARSRQVRLDSCWVRAETANDRNSFRIFFDVLKMTNLDFAALYKKNLIKADSVYVDNPDIELALDLKRKLEKGKRLELDTIIQQFTGDLALGYIGVQNATVNIVANRGDTATTFSSKNDNFKMYGLRVNSDSSTPVYVDEFMMVLRNYETYSRDSSALYRFDSLRFTNNKVRLSNFTIQSIAGRNKNSTLNYTIPVFELTGLSWEALLFDRYISAEKAVLLNPDIAYSIHASTKKKSRSSLFKILSGLNETINLHAVEIQNGNLNIQLPAGKQLNLKHVDLVLASNKLLASTTYTGMQQAIDALAFRSAVFRTSNLRAELINLQYADRLYADELRISNTANTLTARAKGITLDDLIWNNEDKSVFVDGLGWQQASVIVKPGGKGEAKKQMDAVIQLHNLTGRNTTFTIYAKDRILKTTVATLKLDDLEKSGAIMSINGLTAEGKTLDFTAPAFQVKGGSYRIVDNGASSFRALSFIKQSLHDTIRIFIPQTFSKAHVADLLKGNLEFDKITLMAPRFYAASDSLKQMPTPSLTQQAPLPYFSINQLAVQNPVVYYAKRDSAGTTLTWSEEGKESSNNSWTFFNLHTEPRSDAFVVEKAELSGSKALFIRNGKPLGIDSGRVHTTFTNIRLTNKAGLHWEAHLQEAVFKNPISPALKIKGGLGIDEARLQHLNLSSDNVKSVYQILHANPAMQLQLLNGSYVNEASQLHWKALSYSQKNRALSIDSFSYKPAQSRDSFIAKAPAQTDYMHGVLKKIRAEGIDLTALERDSTFKAQNVVIEEPELDIYRDKRKPLVLNGLRPLPAMALQNLPVKLSLDTLALKGATVTYTEMSDKTGQEGRIYVNRINAQLFPVRNVNIGTHDSLALRAEGYLMDSAWLRLRLKQSYTDSLGTFAMTLRMKPTNLSVFNDALMPMASVKLVSGELDTVSLRAIGNEYFSFGTMQMYYKNLKIQFLKKGSENQKTVLTRLITFAANNLLLKRGNNSRTGTVYFLRNRDRGFLNFLVKTALSGIASSVGVKKNKKYYRQYKRQQKLYKLPPVDFS